MSKIRILFIINPISGGKRKAKIPGLIETHLDKTKFDPHFAFTAYVGHAAVIASEATDFEVIIAVGGDGTINEIGSAIVHTEKILGIIPFGSGNGLARFLKIPMDPKRAILLINQFQMRRIDSARLNDRYFFNMAGLGFDAHISAVFAGNKRRGLKSYIELGLKEMISYRPQSYQISIDGKTYSRNAMMVSVANSSQYGNNVYISPKSSLTDGLLDICIVKPFPLYKLPVLAYQMLRATTDQSDLVEIKRGKHILINRAHAGAIHLDGEPFEMGNVIEMEVLPSSLTIIAR